MKGSDIHVTIANILLLQHASSGHIERMYEGIKYPCDKCGYAATSAAHLKTHKERKHDASRYPCDKCDYAALTAGGHIVHKERKQEGVNTQ